jgi:hypothetical protein
MPSRQRQASSDSYAAILFAGCLQADEVVMPHGVPVIMFAFLPDSIALMSQCVMVICAGVQGQGVGGAGTLEEGHNQRHLTPTR